MKKRLFSKPITYTIMLVLILVSVTSIYGSITEIFNSSEIISFRKNPSEKVKAVEENP